jgi:hypothetical protein
MRRKKGISESNNFLTKELSSVDSVLPRKYSSTVKGVLQYFQGSTAVLSGEYSSTSTEVLEPGKIVVF